MAQEQINSLIEAKDAGRPRVRLPAIGFWSYSRQDDDLSKGKLSSLRALLMSEIQQQYGRERIQLFQDVSTIPHGAKWEQETTDALHASTFFIPIITPNFVQSEWCCKEVAIFLEREAELYSIHPDLPRHSRTFPLYLIDIAGADPFDPMALAALEARQWFDFRTLRHRDYQAETVQHALSDFASSIRDVLQFKVRPALTAEERERQVAEAAATRARQEEALRRREIEEAEAEVARVAAKRAAEAQRRLEAEEKARREAERRAEQEQLEAERLAERERRAEKTAAAAAARRAERAQALRRAMDRLYGLRSRWHLWLIVAAMAAVVVFSWRIGQEEATDAPLPPPRAPARLSAPAWLLGRWNADSAHEDCRAITTIRGQNGQIIVEVSGPQAGPPARQTETVEEANAGVVMTRMGTIVTRYTRETHAIRVKEGDFPEETMIECP